MLSIDLSQSDAASLGILPIPFARGITQAWPATQQVKNVSDPRIFGTVFQDTELFREEFAARLIAQAERQPRNLRGVGGTKVRDSESWSSPAAMLIAQRALLFFCRAHNVQQAYVADRWANVMRNGDYSTPHCHYLSDSAVVYTLDRGDEMPHDSFDGSFELIDPRIPACCPYEPERPIRGLSPRCVAGLMLLFPAEWIHHVRPYSGNRPRITLAWNMCRGLPPRDRVIDPTRDVPFLEMSGKATA